MQPGPGDIDRQLPIGEEIFLDHVGQPVRLKGTVVENGDTLIFEIDPAGITLLP